MGNKAQPSASEVATCGHTMSSTEKNSREDPGILFPPSLLGDMKKYRFECAGQGHVKRV